MKPPITWYGGKQRLCKWLSQFIPPHETYLEVFGGSAALLFHKSPSSIEIYNDIDSGLVNMFRVIRDRKSFEEFSRLVALTPYAREAYYDSRDYQYNDDPVIRAYNFYVVAWMSFSSSGGKHGWSYSKTSGGRGMARAVSRWLQGIDRLEDIHGRIRTVQIENLDWKDLLDKYIDSPGVFAYLDPPYYPDTRGSPRMYDYEMSQDDHSRLVSYLVTYPHACVLSGYADNVYNPLGIGGWVRVDKEVTEHSRLKSGGKCATARVESVWINQQALRKDMRLF